MRTKNAKPVSRAESEHMASVKALPCSVCDQPGPSEAHHVRQGDHFTTVALCTDCHTGSRNGIHGQRLMWSIKKIDEIGALSITFRRLLGVRL